METLGDRLKFLREEHRLTQKEVANIIGTTDVSIGRYEMDSRIPKVDILNNLAKLYNVDIDYLLTGNTTTSSNKKIGKKIFDARKKLGITRKELGLKLNLHESTVKRYEDGDIKTLDIDKLRNFASILNLDFEYLIGLQNNSINNNLENDLKKVIENLKSNFNNIFYDGIKLDNDDLEKIDIAIRTVLEIKKHSNK